MEISTGEKAAARCRALMQTGRVIGLAPYPAPSPQLAPAQLLALASETDAVVVDVAATPQIWPLLASDVPFATHAAKPLARTLLGQQHVPPRRWAALEVMQGLLQAGRPGSYVPSEQVPATVANHFALPPPPTAMGEVADLARQAHFYCQAALAQGRALQQAGMGQVSRLEAAVVTPLAHLEHNGMALDTHRWRALVADETAEKNRLETSLAQALKITPAALQAPPQALLAALQKQGHKANALNEACLRQTLQVSRPAAVAAALLRHQALQRLLRSHGSGFLQHVQARDGRIRAHFAQLGAQTGRIACQSPNLQAIPKAHSRRACFRPGPSRSLILADYAACELRILAEVSQDGAYLAAFARGDDVHAQVAQAVFNTEVSRTVQPQLREAAKTLSFGLVYGMQVQGLGALLGCSRQEAESLFDRFFATYPQVRAYLEDSEKQAMRRGYAQTLTGRRLFLPQDPTGGSPGHITRLARNMPIQGTGADMMKLALTRVHHALGTSQAGGLIVHCVHDALLVECPDAAAPQLAVVVAQQMRAAGAELLQQVSCEVDVQVAKQWI